MTEFTIVIPEIKTFVSRYHQAPEKVKARLNTAIKQSAIAVQAIAMSQAPVRTGKLRANINMEAADLEARVFADLKAVPYAVYVHDGTGIYGQNKRPIVPKTKSVLATKINPGWGSANAKGYYIIGKSSKGQKPNPFMKRAYDLGQAKVSEIFRESERLLLKDFEV